ncbi:ABC transporter permease [Nonomuraea sp. NPDC046570]|uniref:ABC transporter permease n=1 Tax=Nonomuraea sp. NPDC046570 TaxID=3155255 RepID=UPI0033F338A7
MKKILIVETKLHLREWPAMLFTIGLPLGLLLILGSMPGFSKADPALGGESVNDTHMPAMMTMLAMMTLAFSVLPGFLASYREQGILRRMSTTPVGPARVLGAQLVVSWVTGIITTTLIIVLGRLVLGTAVPKQFLGFVLMFLLGSAALLAMGLVLSALVPNGKTASGVGSLVMFPLMFVGGMWIPRESMPDVMRIIGDYSVAGPFAQTMRDTWAGNAPQLTHVLVVSVALLVFGGLAVRLFRWE